MHAPMLSPKQLERYQQEGAVFPIHALRADEVAHFRAGFDILEQHFEGHLPRIDWLHLHFPWAFDLCHHPDVLDAVEQVIGSDILIAGTLVFCKYPQTESFVSWHQDGAYMQMDPRENTTAWIALTESNAQNGCMRVVINPAVSEPIEHIIVPDQNNLLKQNQVVASEVDEALVRDVELPAGSMSLHQNNIIHASNPNRSDGRRIGFIIRFATPRHQGKRPVIRARGTADCPHLNLVKPVIPATHADSIAAMERHRKQLEQEAQ